MAILVYWNGHFEKKELISTYLEPKNTIFEKQSVGTLFLML